MRQWYTMLLFDHHGSQALHFDRKAYFVSVLEPSPNRHITRRRDIILLVTIVHLQTGNLFDYYLIRAVFQL